MNGLDRATLVALVRSHPDAVAGVLLALGYRVIDPQGRELDLDLVDVHGQAHLRSGPQGGA